MKTLTAKQAAVVRAVSRSTRVTLQHQTGAVQTVIRGLVARGILAVEADGTVRLPLTVERS
jgi:hypothetical protein